MGFSPVLEVVFCCLLAFMCSVHVTHFIPLSKFCVAIVMAMHCIVVTLVPQPYPPLPFLDRDAVALASMKGS